MRILEAFILLLTHGMPILFFAYMATEVIVRNKRKTEHILLSLISICYLLLFVEEYVRNQVDISYSPILSSAWLSSTGIVIPGICLHFLVKLTQLDRYMPKYVYPYVFYIPVIFVIINLALGASLISAQQFIEIGMWKLPVYNAGYYIAMTSSVGIDLFYIIIMLFARTKSTIPEQRKIYNLIIWGVVVSIVWHIIFGYINFGDSLPPYPYLYSGIIWCYFLRYTMKKYDFLNLYDKRFEKLFDLNPDPIVLIDSTGNINNANSETYELLRNFGVDFSQLFDSLDNNIKEKILTSRPIKKLETKVVLNNKRLFLLINTDTLMADNELHILLTLRNVTLQKEYEEEITFLAYHDSLTRLPNRRYFLEVLDSSIDSAKIRNETLVLMLIDIDKIKLLNDNYGHLAGDDAIKTTANILQELVGDRGVVARMGGDEFVLFIKRSPSSKEIELFIKQAKHNFAVYLKKYAGQPIGMSIGVSSYPQDALEAQALINIADQSMYEMKRSHIS